jgi:hypothetical protein
MNSTLVHLLDVVCLDGPNLDLASKDMCLKLSVDFSLSARPATAVSKFENLNLETGEPHFSKDFNTPGTYKYQIFHFVGLGSPYFIFTV